VLLRIFNTNQTIVVSFVFIVAVLMFAFFLFLNKPQPIHATGMPLYNYLAFQLSDYSYIKYLLSFVTIFFSAIIANNIGSRYGLSLPGYLTAFVYVVISSSGTIAYEFPPALPACFFILLSVMSLMNLSQESVKQDAYFNVGFFLSIASLFYLPSLLFFPIFLINFFMLRATNAKEVFVGFSGLIIPYLFVFVYLFWTDSLGLFLAEHFFGLISFYKYEGVAFPSLIIPTFLLLFCIIYLFSGAQGQRGRTMKGKTIRNVLNIFFLTTLAAFFIVERKGVHHIIILAMPVSIYVSSVINRIKNVNIGNILLFVLLLLSLFNLSYSMGILTD